MEYFIFRDGKQVGPISVEKLYDENIDGETLVWNTGMKEWTKAKDVPELAPIISGVRKPEHVQDAFGQAFGPTQGQAPGDSHRRQDEYPESDGRHGLSGTQKKKKSHWGCLWTAVILALVVFVMYATNPNKEQHWEKITNEVGEAVVMEENDILGLGGVVNSIATEAIMAFGKNYFNINDYFVCSVGKINYEGEDKVVSVGLLNHVFTFNKEDVTTYLQDAMKTDVAGKAKSFTETITDNLMEGAKNAVKSMIEEFLGDTDGGTEE